MQYVWMPRTPKGSYFVAGGRGGAPTADTPGKKTKIPPSLLPQAPELGVSPSGSVCTHTSSSTRGPPRAVGNQIGALCFPASVRFASVRTVSRGAGRRRPDSRATTLSFGRVVAPWIFAPPPTSPRLSRATVVAPGQMAKGKGPNEGRNRVARVTEGRAPIHRQACMSTGLRPEEDPVDDVPLLPRSMRSAQPNRLLRRRQRATATSFLCPTVPALQSGLSRTTHPLQRARTSLKESECHQFDGIHRRPGQGWTA